jgi:single-strand DNA-binding protein
MAYSVNQAIILGNLTRDPELRYTPAGHAVCSFSVATNRSWTTSEGDQREKADFHNVVAWRKLAEICSQYLIKGQKVYVQGRLQTRTWEGQDGNRRSRTEIVADQVVMLQRPRGAPAPQPKNQKPAGEVDASEEVKKEMKEEMRKEAKGENPGPEDQSDENVDPEEVKKKMPF